MDTSTGGRPRPAAHRPNLAAAADFRHCHGWGTLVRPDGNGLEPCPDCQHTAPADTTLGAAQNPRSDR